MSILIERGLFWKNTEVVPITHFAPENAVFGALTIDDDGLATVELDAVLSDPANPFAAISSQFVRPEIGAVQAICGKLKDSGRFVYLDNVFRSGGRFRSSGISYEKWSANACLVGSEALPAYPWKPKTRRISFELIGYEEWLGLSDLHLKAKHDDDSNVTVSYAAPDAIRYEGSDATLSIVYNFYRPRIGSVFSAIELRQTATAVLETNTSLSLDGVVSEHACLWDILVLLTDCERNINWPELTLSEGGGSCTLYFSRIHTDKAPPEAIKFWINFPEIEQKFGSMYFAWRELRERVGPGAYLYLATRRGIKMYFEHKYVNLVWGLEAFHRANHPTDEMPPKLAAKVARILSAVGSSDRKWLDRAIAGALGMRLQDRLSQLINQLPIGLQSKAVTEFTKNCATKRNDISHLGGSREGKGNLEFRQDIEDRIEVLAFYITAYS